MDVNKQELNSVAVWLESLDEVRQGSEGDPYLHLDLNIWATKQQTDNYLEIGFKVFSWEKVKSIRCILPFELDMNGVSDKGAYLRENPKVLSALFNEAVDLHSNQNNEQFIGVSFPDVSSDVQLFLFCPDRSCMEIKPLEELRGSELKISLPEKDERPENSKNSALYIRIRFRTNCLSRTKFRVPCLEPIIKVRESVATVLTGKSEVTSFVDFKLNSYRSLPWEVQAKVKKTRILSINLFLMTDAWYKMVFESNGTNASRLLEHHIWNGYLSDNHEISSLDSDKMIVAYHWKKRGKQVKTDSKQENNGYIKHETVQYERIQSYNIFIKLFRVESTIRSVLKTVFYVVLFGAVSGLLGNWISSVDWVKSLLGLN